MKRRSSLALTALVVGACSASPRTTDVIQQPLLCTDSAQVQPKKLDRSPPPISGGTLLVTADQLTAVAADSERDLVWLVDLTTYTVRGQVALQPGDEPGRMAEDAAGQVHVALRQGGALVTLDPKTGKIVGRRPVCASPRGVAYEKARDLVHVACSTGELVSLPSAASKPASRTITLESDLRDVIVSGDKLLVSRFRSAELLTVGADGTLLGRGAPSSFQAPSVRANQPFDPAVAWRTVAFGGGALMLHQRGMSTPVITQSLTTGQPQGSLAGGQFGGPVGSPPPVNGPPPGNGGGSSYGGGGGGGGQFNGGGSCSDGIVHSTLSFFDNGTTTAAAQGVIPDATVALDVAVKADGSEFSIAAAGNANLPQLGDVFTLTLGTVQSGQNGCIPLPTRIPTGQPVAVAYAGDLLVVQTREPSMLVIPSPTPANPPLLVTLGTDSVGNPGHELFHRNSGGNLACASCHPEGGDDGRTWQFDFGPRRTQNLRGGLLGTEPFHWTGDQVSMMDLVNEVFTHRMGGAAQSCDQIGQLASWVDTVKTVAAVPAPPADSVARGRALFMSPSVGCASCHAGPLFTNNATVDVGTGGVFQVPRLANLAARAPFLHDGCAKTLQDRFGPCGGGDMHGHTSQLAAHDVDDLVSFLKTL